MSLVSSRKLTLVIIDDEESFRSNIVRFIKSKLTDVRIIEYSSPSHALTNHFLSQIDFLIVDYRMPEMDGIQFFGEAKIRQLTIPKLILSGFVAEDKIFEALKLGATGYLCKDDIDSFDSILEILLNGGAFITPTIACRVVSFFKDLRKNTAEKKELTEIEAQILKNLSSGFSTIEVAESIGIDDQTFYLHIRNIYKKLEINHQHQLLKGKS
ncbi:MAG: response regulator transcription factor [Leptospira sp.]|nr:response regulator transcription factor [Leptospira sp.]